LVYRGTTKTLYTEGEGLTALDGPQDERESLQYGYAVHVEEDFYTVDEAAKILKLTPGRIRQMLLASDSWQTDLQPFVRRARLPSKGLREASEG
jgi:hypothetical protein